MTEGSGYNLQVKGDVKHSQIAVGKNILQIGAVTGGRVVVVDPSRIPEPQPRPLPILARGMNPPGFLNRTHELTRLKDQVSRQVTVEVTGSQGIGKSWLLRKLAWSVDSEKFPSGIVVLRGSDRPAADLLQDLFEHFYETFRANDLVYKPTSAGLQQRLSSTRALVVIDDAGLDPPELQEILDSVPQCAVVVVSSATNLAGQADTLQLAGLPEDAGLELVAQLLERPLAPEERSAAAALSARCAGNPLLIRQEIGRIRAGAAPLAESPPGAAPPALADAGAMLRDARRPATERRVLTLLALLFGGAIMTHTVRALGAVDDIAPVLDALQVEGLVLRDAGTVRLAEHVTLDGETRTALAREGIDQIAERLSAELDAGSYSDTPEVITRALKLCAEAGQHRALVRLVRAAAATLIQSMRWGAWREALEACLDAARTLQDRHDEAWALHELGTRALCLGHLDEARKRLTEALKLRRKLGEVEATELTRHNLQVLRITPGVPWFRIASGPGRLGALVAAGILGVGATGAAAAYFMSSSPLAEFVPPSPFRAAVGQFQRQTIELRAIRGSTSAKAARLIDSTAAFSILDDGCRGKALEPEDKCAVVVRYAPKNKGPHETELVVYTNAKDVTVSLSGTASQPPSLGIDPPGPIDFSSVPVGTQRDRELTLFSAGEGELTVQHIDVEPADAGFGVEDEKGCAGRLLGARQQCSINVVFAPREAGKQRGELRIASTAAEEPYRVALRGDAVHGALVVEPSALKFAPQPLRTSSKPQRVVLHNDGPGTLRIDSAHAEGSPAFKLSDGCKGKVLPTGESCKLTVDFTPAEVGPARATVTLRTNAPGGARRITLVGAGLTPQPDLVATITKASVVETPVAELTVVVRNQGGAAAGGSTLVYQALIKGAKYAIWRKSSQVGPLAPGGTWSETTRATMTGDVQNTNVTFRAEADSCAGVEFANPGCRVLEANENNNLATSNITFPLLDPESP